MVIDSDENTTSSSLAARSALLGSPVERAVVEFLLVSGPRAGAMSAREVAEAVGTSDATVIRTARSLGFEGYRGLRRFMASQSVEVPIEERLRKSLDAVENPDAELARNIERQSGALMAMAERIPESEFHEANRILQLAPYVWWSGVGPSAFLAGYGAFLFRRLGKDSGALTHAGFDGADELLSVRGTRRRRARLRQAAPACPSAPRESAGGWVRSHFRHRFRLAVHRVANPCASLEWPRAPWNVRFARDDDCPHRGIGPFDGSQPVCRCAVISRTAQCPPRQNRRPTTGCRPLTRRRPRTSGIVARQLLESLSVWGRKGVKTPVRRRTRDAESD